MKIQSIVFVLSGIVVGCGAGATLSKTRAAADGDGPWHCVKTSLLPDLERARGIGEARAYETTLAELAPGAPAGTVLQLSRQGSDYNFLCAKQ